MIRLAIVEDEDTFAQALQGHLERYGQEKGVSFAITRFSDGDEIAQDYAGGFDLILMDIQMRFMDGMTAAERIRERDEEVLIIFITNMTTYAIRGYAVDALDYIVKPVEYFSFSKKMDRAMDRLSRLHHSERHLLTLTLRSGVKKIDVEKLLYVESEGHNLIYHTRSGEYRERRRMQDLCDELEPLGFFRCNKGSLVNLALVDGVEDGCALLGEDRVPISRARRSDFMAALMEQINE